MLCCGMFGRRNNHRLGRAGKNRGGRKPTGGGNSKANNQKPGAPGHKTMAEMIISKMPAPPDLTSMLNTIVYVQPFSEVNKDILRLIRRVSVLQRTPGEEDRLIVPANEELPAAVVNSEKEGVYIVMLLMNTLLTFFEEEQVAEDLMGKMNDLYMSWLKSTAQQEGPEERNEGEEGNEGEEVQEEQEEIEDKFTVLDLIDAIGGDKTRTALAVRCIHQSVAICGHTHIKYNVCPFMTKDVRGNSGWQVVITLAEYVQVKHTRRESSIESPRDSRNHWEMQFDVHMTFDRNMTEITATKLTVTDLFLSETMDEKLADYLEEKYNKGNLVVC